MLQAWAWANIAGGLGLSLERLRPCITLIPRNEVIYWLFWRRSRSTMEVDVSVVIPVYRSAATLHTLVKRLFVVLSNTRKSFEIIFVDDGSPDNSWEVVCDLQRSYPDRIVAIQLMRNYGQHNALMCGFRHSRGKYTITMDDDLQNPPEEIPKLLQAIETEGLDLVYGSYDTKKHRCWRNIGSALVNWLFRIVFHCRVTPTSFRVMDRRLMESILPYSLNFTYIDGHLAWNTERVGTVRVEHHPRAVGRSGYSLGKLAVLALNLFTNFSLLPLQLVSVCGLAAAGSGFILACSY